MSIDTHHRISSDVSLFCQTVGETFPIDSLFECENLPDQLDQLVRHGCQLNLKADWMNFRMPSNASVLRCYGEDKLSLLMVATLHGDDDIVRLLLTWDPSNKQIELQDTFLREDRTRMTGVTALYCFVHVIEDIFMWQRYSSNWAKAMSMEIHWSIPDIHDFSVLRNETK